MEYKTKNREWVKNAAIIFLSVLLVLTFFSNTWMNRSLPEVATQNVTSGTITAKVRGTGTVTAVGSHVVKANQTREIRAVMVKAGQEVKTGDVLFVLGQGEASELEAAQEQLRQLQLNYQRTAAGINYPSYALEERRIADARQAVEDARAARDRIQAQSNANLPTVQLQNANNEVLADTAALETAKQNLTGEQITLETVTKAYEDNVNDARGRADEKAAADTEAANAAAEKEAARVSASDTATRLNTEYLALYSKRQEQLAAGGPAEGEAEVTEQMLADALAARDAAADAFTEAAASAQAAAGEAQRASEAAQLARESLDAAIEANSLVLEQQAKVDAAQAAVDEAEEKLRISTEKRDAIQATIDEILGQDVVSEELVAANKALKEAEDALFELEFNLKEKKAADSRSQTLSYIDLTDLNAQIEAAKKKVADLSGGEENQITASVNGTVQSIECTAGDTKLKGDVLCTIEVPDMGYSLSFSVTNDQARRLKPGDSASVSNYYWGNTVNAKLDSIKTDPKNPQTNKLLTFTLDGSVTAGAELTLSVGQKSAPYDTIVPKSAIRSDTNGSFVLSVEAKNSPLGNRYIAKRVEVTVLAEDDVNAAVTAELGYGAYVITTSSAPVKNGDMVRLADNG